MKRTKKDYGKCESLFCAERATNKHRYDNGEIHYHCAKHNPRKLPKHGLYVQH